MVGECYLYDPANFNFVKQMPGALDTFDNVVLARKAVTGCRVMSGDADDLPCIVVADMLSLQRFIVDHVARIPYAAYIRSNFALKRVKYKMALHLPAQTRAAGRYRALRPDRAK